MKLSDFDFELPPELIAQHPAPERSASRLLAVSSAGALQDQRFTDIVDLLNPGDVLIFNDSRVIPARLYGAKATGGQVEILTERILGTHQAIAMLRVSKKPASGSLIHVGNQCITVLGRDPEHDDRFRLRFDAPVLDVLHQHGEVPLPPYITHKPDAQDRERYQTVYAQAPGSVAAPTAGLHFDQALLKSLKAKGIHCGFVTLHVGTGTFAPVRSENIHEHRMHSEWCEIPQATADLIKQARHNGKRVVAVGTTSMRTLESAAIGRNGDPAALNSGRLDTQSHGLVRAGSFETDIFITPGFEFKVVDVLVTNFHLPRSTLLMLVSAFIGYDTMRQAYAHAVAQRYRFFSYGDAMFCERSNRKTSRA